MMTSPWIAALFALFVWWFSTGAILWAVKRADGQGTDAHLWSVLLGLPLLFAGVAGLTSTLDGTTAEAAYLAFLSSLAIWGWIELSFLSGVITGPNTYHCPPRIHGWERFLRAWGTIAYHEMLLAASLGAILWVSWGVANSFGFWTFAVLFFARVSAKLNLFLGVPKINIEFLPDPLAHLPSHFRHAALNALFPVSVTALSFAVACWLERLFAAATPADIVGFALLSALTGLALLEHWLMVLPLPDAKLWRWMIPAPKTNTKRLIREDPNGL